MQEPDNVNNDFQNKVLDSLEKINKDQSNAILRLSIQVETLSAKVVKMETDLATSSNRIGEIEKQGIIQENQVTNQKEKIDSISSFMRWVVLLILSAVILALINLIIVENPLTSSNTPSNQPVIQNSVSDRRNHLNPYDITHVPD